VDRSSAPPWVVVLAGGSGRRLTGVTGGVPKQFWAPMGGRTLLEATLERVAPLAAPSQRSLVIDASHTTWLHALNGEPRGLRVLRQPCDRGTATGVLLGLVPALESGRDGVVVLTPADHGVIDTERFRSDLRTTMDRVAGGSERLILFGAEPDAADADYGWVVCDSVHTAPGVPTRVREFVEKPPPAAVALLRATGAVWSTMLVVARVSSLLALYRRRLPELTAVFERVLRLPQAARGSALVETYGHLAAADFSRDLLAHADGLAVHVWPSSLGWTDLGTPERLARFVAGLERARHARQLGVDVEASGLGAQSA